MWIRTWWDGNILREIFSIGIVFLNLLGWGYNIYWFHLKTFLPSWTHVPYPQVTWNTTEGGKVISEPLKDGILSVVNIIRTRNIIQNTFSASDCCRRLSSTILFPCSWFWTPGKESVSLNTSINIYAWELVPQCAS